MEEWVINHWPQLALGLLVVLILWRLGARIARRRRELLQELETLRKVNYREK